MADLVGSGYNSDIAYRYKPNQTQAEFYSQKTGQTFGDPNVLANYVNQNYAGSNANAGNVFSLLAGGYNTPTMPTANSGTPTVPTNTSSTPNTPTVPTWNASPYQAPNIDYSNYNNLSNQIQNSFIPSADEQSTQQTEDNLIASRDLGINKIKDQAIPLELNIGQSQSLMNQAATQIEPLQQKLSRMQAARTASLEASKFALTQEQNKIDQLKNDSRYAYEKNYEQSKDQYGAQTDTYNRNQASSETALKNATTLGLNQPYYKVGNVIYDTATQQPKYEDVGGEIRSLTDGTKFSSAGQFFQHSGIKSWDQIQSPTQSNQATKFETVTLGSGKTARKVRYGYDAKGNVVSATDLATGQSLSTGIGAGGASISSVAKAASSPTPSTPKAKSTTFSATPAGVKSWILANKQANPNVPYYDLWGQLADELKAQNLNPSNYDAQFWEILSPQGSSGYKANQSTKKGA